MDEASENVDKEDWQKELALVEKERMTCCQGMKHAEDVSTIADFRGLIGTEQENSEQAQRME